MSMTTVDRYPTAQTYIPPAVPSPPSHSYTRNSPLPRPIQYPSEPLGDDTMAHEADQWYYSDAEVENTPSILHGLSLLEERNRRAKGINFLAQAGALLRLPQITLSCASTIAAVALFLATKAEENGRKTKEIVIAVARVAQKNPGVILDEQSKEYWKWRDSLLKYEELMLEQLTFDVVIQTPHIIFHRLLQDLQIMEVKPIRNSGWAMLNDSTHTILCLIMSPKDVAIAGLYFGAKYTGEVIPDVNGLPWWEYVGGDVHAITKAVKVLTEFWVENPLKKENPQSSPASSQGEDLDRTRAKGQPESRDISPEEVPALQNGHTAATPSLNSNKPNVEPLPQLEDRAELSRTTHDSAEKSYDVAIPEPQTNSYDTSGASDAAEKAAANDPTTHANTESSDLLKPTLLEPILLEPKVTPKRKGREHDEDEAASAKRAKVDDEHAATGSLLHRSEENSGTECAKG